MDKKKINIAKVMVNYIATADLETEPILLEIEPTNHCNLNCLMCPNKEMIRKRGYMDLSLFKEIVDQTINTAWEYSIGVQGEPTMHMNLVEMIKYIKAKGGKVTLNTNMNYQNDEMAEYFVRSNVDRIIVTICAADKSTYEKIVRNGNFSLLIHNLLKIREMKKRLKKRKPTIVASFVKMKMNIEQVNKAKRELKKYFDYCNIASMHDWAGNREIAALKPRERMTKTKRKCSVLWTTATVLWDGRVTACCCDYDGKVVLGDTKLMKIRDIWNSQKVKQFRRRFLDSDLCKHCDGAVGFQFSRKNLYYTLRTTV